MTEDMRSEQSLTNWHFYWGHKQFLEEKTKSCKVQKIIDAVPVTLVLDAIYSETRLKRLSVSSNNERLTPFGCREEIFVSGGGCVVQALS